MTDMTLIERPHSVTRHDTQEGTYGGVWIWNMIEPSDSSLYKQSSLPANYCLARERMLAAAVSLEDMWSSAVALAISKFAIRSFDIADSADSAIRTKRAQELLLNFDGPGNYTTAIYKHLYDFVTQDNGAFIEIERDRLGRIVALWHLDSQRCRRTGNRMYPIVYSDLEGNEFALRYDQVLFFADMPSARQEAFGIGMCATRRAWKTIVKLSAIETYFKEKITGSGALALHFVSGLNPRQLEDARKTANIDAINHEQMLYKGAMVIPVMGDKPVAVASVDLASIPDRFDVEKERDRATLIYANALGVPFQDLQPLSGQGFGTGTQSEVLKDVADSKGALPLWATWFTRVLNHLVLSETTTHMWVVNDLEEQLQRATIAKTRAEARSIMINNGEISSMQALNMAVDAKDIPPEFLAEDQTEGGILSDSGQNSKVPEQREQPAAGEESIEDRAAQPNGGDLQPRGQSSTLRQKAQTLRIADLDDAAALEAAARLYASVKGRR